MRISRGRASARESENRTETFTGTVWADPVLPTQDDVTREAISAVTRRALIRDPKIEDDLRRRFAEFGRPMPEMNVRQADVPDGAMIIEQSWGTAPGLIVEYGDGVIYAVPGVPAEMEDMLARAVLPDLLRRAGQPSQIVSRVVRIAGVSESTIAEQLRDVWDILGGETTMAFLAGGGEVRIRLTAKASDPSRAQELVAAAEASVRASLGAAVVGIDDETLESVVGTLLLARGWSLGTAESLTGGALGSRVSSSAGTSEYFRGSIVSYATEVKEEETPVGYFDNVIDIFNELEHPVILLEHHAFRWMAMRMPRNVGCNSFSLW